MAVAAGTRLMCGPLPPVIRENQSPMVAPTKTVLLHPQVTREGGQKLQAKRTLTVSRRDMMICLTAQTMSLATFWPTEPAEAARISKSEMKRKILEKLQQLREKAGIAKPKNENEEKQYPEPPSGKDEKKLQALSPSQSSPEYSVETLVEAALDQVLTFIP
ncbi:hypothetical protein PanWU01x14_016450 [Parasponia andersonii]|uniref:Uncharacterized protein n=1 Tax=Parasponia andersonii TaxID=3476 RepID=A0A2P5DZS8_PARAD|nr:hypothetical protein PanWU01x14_016450 [Parasponia andersonii]